MTTTVTYLDGKIDCVGGYVDRCIILPNGERERLEPLNVPVLDLENNRYRNRDTYETFMEGDHMYLACVFADLDDDCDSDGFEVIG